MLKVGDVITAKVSGIKKYGIFLRINSKVGNYTGLIHISEVSNSFIVDIGDYVKLNEIIKVKVLAINKEEKKLDLSIKDIDYHLRGKGIQETKKGFSTLDKKLNIWIDRKYDEIVKKSEKNS